MNKVHIEIVPCEKNSEIAIICNKLAHISDEDQNPQELKIFEKEFIDGDAHTLPQHIHMLSNEEINVGDIVVSTFTNWKIQDGPLPQLGKIIEIHDDHYVINMFDSGYLYNDKWDKGHSKKVIKTTDPDLNEITHISLETLLKYIDTYNNNNLEYVLEEPKTYTREDIEALFDLFEKDIQDVASGVYGGGIKHWLKENL